MSVILCYGDSNTWGFDIDSWKPEGPTAAARFPAAVRWTGVLAAELGAAHRVVEEGLNGRTTVFDDPVEGAHRNGLRYLVPCLESQAPLDVLVLCLGINDTKERFAATAYDIASGAALLAKTARDSCAAPGGKAPFVLMVSPFPLGKGLATSPFAEMFAGEKSIEKSRLLAARYEAQAAALGLGFMDAGKLVTAHPKDSLHLTAASHRILGQAIAARLRELGYLGG